MVAKQNAVPKETRPSRIPSSDAPKDLHVIHHGPVKSDPTQLDRIIHERIRLGIVSALAVNESLTFNELKRIVKTTDGNLCVHARKLEEASYLECRKTFEGRVPKTEYRLTKEGKKALERYLAHMEAFIKATRGE